MKKMIGLAAIVMLAIVAGTGCSSLFGEKANGIILYGTDEQLSQATEKVKPDVSAQETYPIKVDEQDSGTMVVISKSTAEGLLKSGLLQEVKDKATKPIKELPALSADKAIIFAKTRTAEATVKGNKLTGSYSGDVVIGESRSYAETIVVMDDTAWKKLNADHLGMAVVTFKKDPKHLLGDVSKEVRVAQMVRISK
ncbi:lipoprotein BA_5634 family protein [Paenibacillus apiarius]|uniref:Lipoprotein BA_5634 family protein n=1 Tax=Paenibacillus apiarius TaxID=46240 RepID=A0ABT4DUW9_9BACL|nr:lipoprotein BA_5634 family protein [Paenibacillus apiarius]MBN3523461.1 hypothetical protein [Paenibacillus apiarius]MCY9516396.1 lipoprotein BA_5634 family protein [Paenibacillus apiarius]MCY9521144.1 lipoprotein BA_5634 family protein [Paenibacillus apiarius]MCY9551991.1 lipoprotein BA_5634 family protein [Paenibacillus apiarius]MCY9560936.1 lipoprotein BA_5634 family protein [Paenibacillus apiarius]